MRKQLTRGVFWLGGARLVVNLLAMTSTLVLARLLTPSDFGLVALAITVQSIVSSVTELSLSSALIHHSAPTDEHFQAVWTLNFCRALVIGLLLCAASPFIGRVYGEPRLSIVLAIVGLSTAVAGLSNPKTVMLNRELVFWQEFAMTVTQKLAGFAVGTAIALAYHSYWALVAGMVASQFTGLVMSYVVVRFKPRFSLKHARELYSFSVWLTLGQVVNTLNWRFDQLLVGRVFGRASLGVYTVGDNLAGMPTRELIGPLEATLFPGFARMANDVVRLKQAYQAAQTLITTVALPAGVGCALIARPLVLIAMGPKWLPVVEVIQVLACVYAVQTISAPVHALAMAKGETRQLFYRDLLSFMLRVPSILIGMELNGFMGVVYARAAYNVIGVTINMVLVRRLIGVPILSQIRSNIRPFISVAAMCGAVQGVLNGLSNIGIDSPIFLIAGGTATGAVTYTCTSLLCWHLCRRPIGPEQVLLQVGAGMLAHLRSKAGSAKLNANLSKTAAEQLPRLSYREQIAYSLKNRNSEKTLRVANEGADVRPFDSNSFHSTMMEDLKTFHFPIMRMLQGKKFHYLDVPIHNNIGDLLILLGGLAFFENHRLRPATISSYISFSPRAVGHGDVLVFHGGGNFGDLYPHINAYRESIISRFPNNPIILLPQTIYFSSDESLRQSAAIFRRHKNVCIFVRDRVSAELAKAFSDQVYLAPDMAHQLYPMDGARPASKRSLRIARVDTERPVSSNEDGTNDTTTDWHEVIGRDRALIDLTVRLEYRLQGLKFKGPLQPLVQWFWVCTARRFCRKAVALFSDHERVVTDRLHGHILATLMNKPSIVIDNSYGKNSTYLNEWTGSSPLVQVSSPK